MITKFDVGDEVFIKGTVRKVERKLDTDGTAKTYYTLFVPKYRNREFYMSEEEVI